MSEKSNVSMQELQEQFLYSAKVKNLILNRYPDKQPKAFIHTYGCQENVADSEHIMGMLLEMGYQMTDEISEADFILFNTCAVREHAEDRVFGNVGAIKKYKAENPNLIIALCGCMMQQAHIREKLYKSYPYVSLVFGTHVLYQFPQLLYTALHDKKRVYSAPDEKGRIAEDLPVYRDRGIKAWLPIMYGCDNFCTYCIVPHVRGRERSREPEDILAEAKRIIAAGYKDITLLGQNVNSYGKKNKSDMNFAQLLRAVNDLEGDFIVRFMTSHPKDCTKELIDTMAECDKVAKHLHLPVQCGNNRVLKAMNRHYDREKYLELVRYAKEKMPDLSLTTDIIVGFPGETYEEFCDTLSLVKEVEYTSLFTFIFSPREGTKAATMEDPISRSEKNKWFKELCDLQEEIAAKRTMEAKGKVYKVLVESESKNGEGLLAGRTGGNVIIDFPGTADLIGTFQTVRVTEPTHWMLKGELIN